MTPNEKRFIERIADYYDDPLGFVEVAFPWGEPGPLQDFTGPDQWQRDLLLSIGNHVKNNELDILRDATASGHGIGKSATVAWIILWAMSTRPHLNGVVTANTFPQLNTKTWRELALWHKRCITSSWFKWTATKFFHIAHPETWAVNAIANSEHNAESFAGQHGKYSLIIYDEASGIPDIIWEVSSGVNDPRTMWFVFGNPTRNTGRFRECFGRFRDRWSTRHVDSRTCAMPNKDELQKDVDAWGEDSDFVRVRIKGEFPRVSDSQFIPSNIVDDARTRSLDIIHWGNLPIVMGVDPARFGDDASAIVIRQGDKLHAIHTYRGLDTQELSAVVVEKYTEHRPMHIFVDGIGVGAGVVDRLKALHMPVVEVAFSTRPDDPSTYSNARAELWGRMREWLKHADIPDHRELMDELISPEYGYNNKMQLQLERKQDLKKRGLASPDHADGLALTFYKHGLAAQVAADPVQPVAASGWS